MTNFARMTVVGNVGQQPEIQTVGNTKVGKFSVAVNEKFIKRDGTQDSRTYWYPVEIWDGNNGGGMVTSIVEPNVKAGTQLLLDGHPIMETYKDKGGETRKAFKLKLAGGGATIRLMGGPAGPKASNGATQNGSAEMPNQKSDFDDDIPF
tara:strand:+ start:181 stop:630 length:450 start_codon:yes stop_codon:yes gene_type:complete